MVSMMLLMMFISSRWASYLYSVHSLSPGNSPDPTREHFSTLQLTRQELPCSGRPQTLLDDVQGAKVVGLPSSAMFGRLR
jgi:hypothetical protein